MPKNKERGSVFVFLVFVFLAIAGVATILIYQTFQNSSKKISKQSETLSVALKTEYQNPFDKSTQYQNPFNDYHNPFDELKWLLDNGDQ